MVIAVVVLTMSEAAATPAPRKRRARVAVAGCVRGVNVGAARAGAPAVATVDHVVLAPDVPGTAWLYAGPESPLTSALAGAAVRQVSRYLLPLSRA